MYTRKSRVNVERYGTIRTFQNQVGHDYPKLDLLAASAAAADTGAGPAATCETGSPTLVFPATEGAGTTLIRVTVGRITGFCVGAGNVVIAVPPVGTSAL